MRLGRKPKKDDPNGLKFAPAAARLRAKLPGAALGRNWTTLEGPPRRERLRYPVFRNLELNDCTCASFGHLDQVASDQTSTLATLGDKDIVDAYAAISDYPTLDRGACNVDAVRYFTKSGLIVMAAELDEGNREHLELAINLCGAAYVGVNLPETAKWQRTWDVENSKLGAPGSWGGHAMMAVAYDAIGVYFITWGRVQRATWEWVQAYCDEAHAVVHRAWVGAELTPSGYRSAELLDDLRAMDVRL